MDSIAICISLASLFVAIWAVRVSKNIAKQQHDDAVKAEQRQEKKERQAEEKRENEKSQELRNRKEARQIANASQMARLAGKTKELEEDIFLDKQLGKR